MSKGTPASAFTLPQRVFVAAFIVALGHLIGTQYIAHHLQYNDSYLGGYLVFDEGVGVKVYMPLKVYIWTNQYWGGYVDAILTTGVGIALASLALGLIAVVLLTLKKQPEASTSHGSSRWLRADEIEALGWKESEQARIDRARREGRDPQEACSVPIGMSEAKEIYYDSDVTHVLGFAPTRSGKGVGMVIPALLTWRRSVVVTDMKGENYQITGWWRKLFSHVIYFNPTDPNSANFNPLFEIRDGPDLIKDAMNVSEIMISGASEKQEDFWEAGAKDLMTATIIYTLLCEQDKSLARVAQLLANAKKLVERLYTAEVSDPHARGFMKETAEAMESADDRVSSAWAATAKNTLNLWKDPTIANNTRTSDFRLLDLQHAEHPVSLYVVVPPNNLDRLSPLLRLFFQQLTDALTEGMDQTKEAGDYHRLLMLLDEFPQYGKMKKIEKAVAYTAGYGIKWYFITQGLDQLDSIYGKDNAILSNCKLRLAYTCSEANNAIKLSKLLGTTTATKEQGGTSKKRGMMASGGSVSTSHVEFQRDLMTPGELQQMSSDRILIMNAGTHPAKEYKIRYYEHEVFIPKYKGRTIAFPTKPDNDFPEQRYPIPWLTSPSSSPSNGAGGDASGSEAPSLTPSPIAGRSRGTSMPETIDEELDEIAQNERVETSFAALKTRMAAGDVPDAPVADDSAQGLPSAREMKGIDIMHTQSLKPEASVSDARSNEKTTADEADEMAASIPEGASIGEATKAIFATRMLEDGKIEAALRALYEAGKLGEDGANILAMIARKRERAKARGEESAVKTGRADLDALLGLDIGKNKRADLEVPEETVTSRPTDIEALLAGDALRARGDGLDVPGESQGSTDQDKRSGDIFVDYDDF